MPWLHAVTILSPSSLRWKANLPYTSTGGAVAAVSCVILSFSHKAFMKFITAYSKTAVVVLEVQREPQASYPVHFALWQARRIRIT